MVGPNALSYRNAAASGGFELLAAELSTALLVADVGSFTRAARRLGLEQSTISRRVRLLEDHLGISLFQRYTHGIELTDAGRAFVEQIRTLRKALDAAALETRQAGLARVGVLRAGFVWSFASGIAAGIISVFREQHGEIRLLLFEAAETELLRRVLHGELDCAWVLNPPQEDPVLHAEPLWSERWWLVRAAAEGSLPYARWDHLAGRTVLCRKEIDTEMLSPLRPRFDRERIGLEAHGCSLETLLSLSAAGQGVLLLPESVAGLAQRGVCTAPLQAPDAVLQLHVVYRRETDNPALRRFLAITRQALKAAAAGAVN